MLGRRHLFRLVGAASIAILAMTASRLIEPVRDVTAEQQTTSESFSTHRLVEFVEHYCLDCHSVTGLTDWPSRIRIRAVRRPFDD